MRRTLLFVVASLLFGRVAAEACSCLPSGPPCEAYWQADAVFVGRVESVQTSPGRMTSSRAVTFSLVEALRGVTGREAVVRTGRGGGDCGYAFKKGATYVVYAWRDQQSGGLTTGICSRTRPLEKAAGDVAYARAVLAGTAEPGRVHGRATVTVEPLQPRARQQAPAPLNGVRVTLQGDGTTYVAVTASDGTFVLEGLPPGKYTVNAEVPSGHYTRGFPREIELKDALACIEIDVRAWFDGRVSGQVLDPSHRPLAGLTVELTVRSGLDQPLGPRRLRTITRGDGTYEFTLVPPGKFVIGVNTQPDRSGHPSEGRVFLPGVSDPQSAREVAVGGGERVRADDFIMPATIRYVPISGHVLGPAGAPAQGARVYLKGLADEDYILTEPAVTDPDGRFTIAALAAGEYVVFAERERDATGRGGRLDASDELPVTADAGTRPVVLRLKRQY
jgi:hypothetical protein